MFDAEAMVRAAIAYAELTRPTMHPFLVLHGSY